MTPPKTLAKYILPKQSYLVSKRMVGMLYQFITLGLVSLLASSCQPQPILIGTAQGLSNLLLQTAKFDLVDSSRHRLVPVVTYSAAPAGQPPRERKLALLNHGYGG